MRWSAADSSLTGGAGAKTYPFPTTPDGGHSHSVRHRVPVLCVLYPDWQTQTEALDQTQMTRIGLYFQLPQPNMLWNISHPFQSIIDAPADLAAARQMMIEKIKADPGAFITKITPAEPSPHTLFDLGKRVFGVK
jgi:hypothetical protein